MYLSASVVVLTCQAIFVHTVAIKNGKCPDIFRYKVSDVFDVNSTISLWDKYQLAAFIPFKTEVGSVFNVFGVKNDLLGCALMTIDIEHKEIYLSCGSGEAIKAQYALRSDFFVEFTVVSKMYPLIGDTSAYEISVYRKNSVLALTACRGLSEKWTGYDLGIFLFVYYYQTAARKAKIVDTFLKRPVPLPPSMVRYFLQGPIKKVCDCDRMRENIMNWETNYHLYYTEANTRPTSMFNYVLYGSIILITFLLSTWIMMKIMKYIC
jgi:hypothetical protein